MISNDLKREIFRIPTGIRSGKTPKSLKRLSDKPFCSEFDIRVRFPQDFQMMSAHNPWLAERVDKDWGDELSWFECSTGNFRKAMHEGSVSLGHLAAEIYCHCLYRVLICFKECKVTTFDEQVSVTQVSDCCTVYHITIFFSEEFPEEFSSLLELVKGYLNALIENQSFEIHKRITSFVRYRSLSIEEVSDQTT